MEIQVLFSLLLQSVALFSRKRSSIRTLSRKALPNQCPRVRRARKAQGSTAQSMTRSQPRINRGASLFRSPHNAIVHHVFGLTRRIFSLPAPIRTLITFSTVAAGDAIPLRRLLIRYDNSL